MSWRWLTAKIENEVDAIEILNSLAKGWYALAIWVTIGGIVFLSPGRGISYFSVVIENAILYFAAGYFLPKRRSRTFSVVLFICALLLASLSLAYRLGLYEGTGVKSIVFAVLAVVIAYRGVRATFVYHARVNSETLWKNVIIVWSIAIAASTLIFLAGVIGIAVPGLYGAELSEAELVAVYRLLLTATIAICFIILPKKFPFISTRDRSNTQ